MEIEIKYQWKTSILDAEKKRFKIEIEILNTGKGEELSICGSGGRSAGQCQDSIKPRTESQKRLLKIWNDYHLNGMNAGTPEQEEALKDCKETDYNKRCEHLKKKGLLKVTLPDGTKYKYGSKWLYRKLPEGLIKEIEQLVITLKAEDEAHKEKTISDRVGTTFEDLDDDKVIALAKALNLTPEQAQDIEIEDGEIYTYEGVSYFVGDEDDTEERCRDYLDVEQWKMAVEAESTTDSHEGWQKHVMNMDGYGHILNSWDGSEDSQEINGTLYYIIRS